VGEEVHVVTGSVIEREGIDPLPEKLRKMVANPLLLPGILHFLGQGFGEPQAMVGLSDQEDPGIGGDPVIS
jgi:hypothetical protein